ncbi:histidine phosphatase family protein [Aurantimonas marianensis]|uniref:Histidine phosphatase family protein n=1 Tax=Aurantimonas marianensis TaxID=2920428 RepID=A0A9X2KJ29_9HYPH|nr:histidine phosphatase family protein [Aurantimonas marianensis]MCP3056217.1 histidine phosphatase family protein [Aurantimonas marianensis]
MMLPQLYLCRHGQTDWNAEGRLQGQEDIALNALGRAQAQRNGRYLRNVLGQDARKFRFLSSPLSRAAETMRIIRTELGLDAGDFATDARLVELHFGDWQGSTIKEVRTRDPQGIAARKADKWNFVPPGPDAESYAMLAERVRPVFESLNEPTIVTAHGGVTRSFLRNYDNLSADEASHIGIPQDRILHFRDAVVSWV